MDAGLGVEDERMERLLERRLCSVVDAVAVADPLSATKSRPLLIRSRSLVC